MAGVAVRSLLSRTARPQWVSALVLLPRLCVHSRLMIWGEWMRLLVWCMVSLRLAPQFRLISVWHLYFLIN